MSKDIAPFEVGEEVVCINDCGYRLFPNEIGPKRGDRLTVRGYEFHPQTNQYGYSFFEIINPPNQHVDGYNECLFLAFRFRRIQPAEYKSAISEILEKYPINESSEVDVIRVEETVNN